MKKLRNKVYPCEEEELKEIALVSSPIRRRYFKIRGNLAGIIPRGVSEILQALILDFPDLGKWDTIKILDYFGTIFPLIDDILEKSILTGYNLSERKH